MLQLPIFNISNMSFNVICENKKKIYFFFNLQYGVLSFICFYNVNVMSHVQGALCGAKNLKQSIN